ncbi:hypothetical protein [Amycolatopsis pretoriensis]|nr:hypothetical protein [Amycolatopsis pretoriensis]
MTINDPRGSVDDVIRPADPPRRGNKSYRARRPAFQRGFPRKMLDDLNLAVELAFTLAVDLGDLDVRVLAKRSGLPAEALEKVRHREVYLPAPRLAGLLRVCGLDEPTVRRAAEATEFLDDAAVIPFFRPTELRLTSAEQDIGSPADLAVVLDVVARRSGIPLKYLAVAAGVSRAQLYSLTGSARMPRKPDQLINLLSVSGLQADDVQHVVQCWRRLGAAAIVAKLEATEPPSPAISATAELARSEDNSAVAGAPQEPTRSGPWTRLRALLIGDRPHEPGPRS